MFTEAVSDKLDYSSWMHFQWFYDNEPFDLRGLAEIMESNNSENIFKDVIFVATKDEAENNYGKELLVAFPSKDTVRILNNLNLYVSKYAWSTYREEVILTDFALNEPITLTDLVDKWENVYQLMKSFPLRRREHIIEYVPK
jgi:hypothetical protein